MVAGWKRLAHKKLDSANATIDTGDWTSGGASNSEHLQVIIYTLSASVDHYCYIRYNGDGASNRYTYLKNANGEVPDGSPNLNMPYNDIYVHTRNGFYVMDITNYTGKEKLGIMQNIGGSTGKTNPPLRREYVSKWVNTSDQIKQITVHQGNGSNTFDVGSYITVWGRSDDVSTDEKATLTNVPNNSRYEETDTRKIYRRIVGNTTTTVGLETSDWTATRSSSPYVASDGTELVYTIYNHSSTAGSAIYDLGSALSDTKWVARIHINNTTTNNDGAIMIQFTNTGGNILTTANADRIYCLLYKNSGQGLNIMARTNGEKNFWSDGAGVAELYSAGDTGVTTGDCYIEITRQSTTTGVIKVGSNSDYTSNTSYTISDLPADVSGLRYIQIGNSNHGTGGTGYTLIGSVKSIKVQDGVDSFIESGWKERGTA